MSDENRDKYPSELAERFQVRLPSGLRDRIKEVAEKNKRSMNAEIVSTLEQAYPPKTIDVEILAQFLENLVGVSAPDGNKELLETVNDALSRTSQPYTVEAGWDGLIKFYPYATPKKPSGDDEE